MVLCPARAVLNNCSLGSCYRVVPFGASSRKVLRAPLAGWTGGCAAKGLLQSMGCLRLGRFSLLERLRSTRCPECLSRPETIPH